MLVSELLLPSANETDIKARFMKHVVTSDSTGCWIWRQAHRGDGEFYLTKSEIKNLNAEGKRVSARRLMYLLTYREIPKGKMIKASCGTLRCVNPAHLVIKE